MIIIISAVKNDQSYAQNETRKIATNILSPFQGLQATQKRTEKLISNKFIGAPGDVPGCRPEGICTKCHVDNETNCLRLARCDICHSRK